MAELEADKPKPEDSSSMEMEMERYQPPTVALTELDTAYLEPSIKEFYNNVYNTLLEWVKNNFKPSPCKTLTEWYNTQVHCTFTIGRSFPEILKTVITTTLHYNEWKPDTLKGISVPGYILHLYSLWMAGKDFEEPEDEEEYESEDDTGVPKPKPPKPANSSATTGEDSTASEKLAAENAKFQEALLSMVTQLSKRVQDIEIKDPAPSTISTASTPTPPPPTAPSTCTAQDDLNKKMAACLEYLAKDKTVSPTTIVFTKEVCEETIRQNNFPMATWNKLAAVEAAKALLALYETGAPINPGETYNNVAIHLSITIQNALAADAFPGEKPILKEKRHLLTTVLAGKVSKQDCAQHSYLPTGQSYRARGNFRSYNRNPGRWNCHGRGGRSNHYPTPGRGGRGRNAPPPPAHQD